MVDPKSNKQAEAESEVAETSLFEKFMDEGIKPRDDKKREEIQGYLDEVIRQFATEIDTYPDADSVTKINMAIAEIDAMLTKQVNEVLHHPEFQQMEGAWRGLHHLVSKTETDDQLKIRVMDVSKQELSKTLKRYKGVAWDQSPIFKKIYGEEYDTPGGHPYGCLVGDYHFDHSPQDCEMLGGIAQVAAASHAPFIAGASPDIMQMESWQELPNPTALAKVFGTPEYAQWNALRDSEDSRYIGLAMPRFLSRLPYGAKTYPVDEFDFEEEVEGPDSSKYTWANSAYAMAVNINQAFKAFGWCSKICGADQNAGVAEDLPIHTFPSEDGGVDAKCPTEIAIGDRRENELSGLGFIPLCHKKNTTEATFYGAQSLQKPQKFQTKDASANAELAANLPYIFATSRFAHYLKCMVRDKIASTMTRPQIERWLQEWVNQYVDGDPENSTDDVKARKPLADAKVVVEEIEGSPGYYRSVFQLTPHYQMKSMSVSLQLSSRIKKSG